jgi:hypothetical protein
MIKKEASMSIITKPVLAVLKSLKYNPTKVMPIKYAIADLGLNTYFDATKDSLIKNFKYRIPQNLKYATLGGGLGSLLLGKKYGMAGALGGAIGGGLLGKYLGGIYK